MPSITLSIDIYGGDGGITYVMSAVAKVLCMVDGDIAFALCGKEEDIIPHIKSLRLEPFLDSNRIFIVESYKIPMGTTSTSRVWRTYPESSLVKSIQLQKDGIADATLSAGDTGAIYATSIFTLGRADGISRPALAATMPSEAGKTVLLLDVGASLDSKPEHLFNFGEIGFDYIKKINGEEKPNVGLLNIGSEDYKGTKKIREAAQLLQKNCLGYNGYVEGDGILKGDNSVVVCDGFVGNVVLKNSEQLFRFMRKLVSGSLNEPASKKLEIFNSEIYGSVPILGIKGNVFKAHGGSSVNALVHAITTALKTLYLLKN